MSTPTPSTANSHHEDELPPIQQLDLQTTVVAESVLGSEDVEMEDLQPSVAATATVATVATAATPYLPDNPMGGRMRRNLSDFSVTQVAKHDKETVSASLEEALTRKRDELASWQEALSQALMLVSVTPLLILPIPDG